MNRWVIPYIDQDLSFWQKISDLYGSNIHEVYLPAPGDVFPNGRSKQPSIHLKTFLKESTLPKAVLINPILLPQPVDEMGPGLVEILQTLREEYGVCRVTVTSLQLARQIKESLPEFKITASVLMGITTPAQVLTARDFVDAISPDTRLTRDIPGLRRIRKAFNGEIRLLVNEACLPGCLYRTQHFYEMAYSSKFPRSLSQQTLDEYPWLRMTGAWVLPQHLHYYDGLYDTLKLAGRVTLQDPNKYIKVLNAYIHRKPLLPDEIGGGPASILDKMEIPDEVFETILICSKNCDACPYCRDYYQTALRNG